MNRLFQILLIIGSFNFHSLAQIPVGNWTGSSVTTETTHAVGIGINQPRAWQEILYCPSPSLDYVGFIVTRNNCNGTFLGFTPSAPDIIGNGLVDYEGNGTENDPEPVFQLPYSFMTGNFTDFNTPLYGTEKPLVWFRLEDPTGSLTNLNGPDKYDTKFIVFPDGSTGINIARPRAALDVRGSQDLNHPAVIFGARSLFTGGSTGPGGLYQYYTQQVHFVPVLGKNGYNRITSAGDQGIFFSDGRGLEGANLAGSFVIAPWANDNDSLVGGLRIDSLGNLNVYGRAKTTHLTVCAQWWADSVLAPEYSLLSLDSVEHFILNYGHLPGMQSQDTIVAAGIDVANVIAQQQAKIEELTLYMIELQKRLAILESKIPDEED
jgi:hypothetical protein